MAGDDQREAHEVLERLTRDTLDELETLSERLSVFSDSALAHLAGLEERMSDMEARLAEKIDKSAASQTASEENTHEEMAHDIDNVSHKVEDLEARLDEIGEELADEE